MKKLLMLTGALVGSFVAFAVDPLPEGGPYKETVSGIEWTFYVDTNLNASVDWPAVPQSTEGAISIPVTLGGRSVTSIGHAAFSGCSSLTNVTIPESVTSIGSDAFSCCSSLTSVTIPDSVTSIGVLAFSCCSSLTSVTIPDSVTSIGLSAFDGCSELTSVTIGKGVTSIGDSAFADCSSINAFIVDADNPKFKAVNGMLLTKDGTTIVEGVNGNVTVPSSVTTISDRAFRGRSNLYSVSTPSSVTSIGSAAFIHCSSLKEVLFEGDAPSSGDRVFYDTPVDMIIKAKEGSSGWIQWNGKQLVYEGGIGPTEVTLTVTNVVVHYIQTSELSPMAAPITPDVGIVNVMTEIEGGIVAVPESWATNYPTFKQKFGNDFAVALTRETGKFDANRKPMYVWQDYVAGTDPTNVEDQFRASVTMVEGKPIISYTPVLSETEAAKRVYTIYGKEKLQDEEWTAIPEGQEADYNFFKVTVKMK